MSFLLDTHTLLWVLFAQRKLSPQAKNIILYTTNQVFVSAISFWELSLKYSLGKLDLKKILPGELPKKAKEAGLEVVSLTSEVASSYYQLPQTAHKDPFDLMLIWQAISQKYTLISKDKQLTSFRRHGLKLIW